KSVGVDVVSAAVHRGANRRQDRNKLAAEDLIEHRDVDLVRLADEAEIDHALDMRTRIDYGSPQLAGDHHVAVLAAEPDRLTAGFVLVADHLFVDQPGQHHFDDFQRLFVGDAQARLVVRLHPDPLEHGLDLRTAAMHHDRVDRGLFEQHDVAGDFARRVLVAHGVAAVFHYNDFLVVALHIGQGFGENAGDVVLGYAHEDHFGLRTWLAAQAAGLCLSPPLGLWVG